MNGLLLDTQVFLWYASGDARLSEPTGQMISSASDLNLTVVSAWEIAIKTGLGKLTLSLPLSDLLGRSLEERAINLLEIGVQDLQYYSDLAFPDSDHRDPFDRMLVAQCRSRGFTLLTADQAFKAYDFGATFV